MTQTASNFARDVHTTGVFLIVGGCGGPWLGIRLHMGISIFYKVRESVLVKMSDERRAHTGSVNRLYSL